MGVNSDLHQDLFSLAQAGPTPSEPFGLYCFVGSDPAAELARYIERTVFLDVFGNSEELLAKEYELYESSSLFLCVMDHLRRKPAGMVRILSLIHI